MITETEVASFLTDFKAKMKIWDVLFRDERGKNAQALIDLELRPIERKAILETLELSSTIIENEKSNHRQRNEIDQRETVDGIQKGNI